MTWLLDLVKVDFKFIDMMPWFVEHVIDMCESCRETRLVLAWQGNSWFFYIISIWVNVIAHWKTQLQQGKSKRKELGEDSFNYVWKLQFQTNEFFAYMKNS